LVFAGKKEICRTSAELFGVRVVSVSAALFTTILDIVPVLLPFLSPGKWALANGADFCWEILFLDVLHD